MSQGGYVYIMANKPFGILYVGVTADLASRITAHREGKSVSRNGSGFGNYD